MATKPYVPKLGHRVKVYGRLKVGEQPRTGKVVEVREGATGTYYGVNVAAPRQPQDVKAFRATELVRA